ncbi:MAG: EAL domain-containing protein [Desulfovibrio sp.]|nr:EAL domain-containing protein [Desulfovibrio sp.]
MQTRRMSERELLDSLEIALQDSHIYPCFQPQFNHSTGRMVGAEALMRWKDPENGMQYPSDFIPLLERNDLLYLADVHIFKMVCVFLRKCLDQGLPLMPISVNMSRYDIYKHEYVDEIEALRIKYDIPVKYLRIEVTESSAIGGMELMKDVISRLHKHGYLVEMDDFGSGYSSLNILKDLNVDIIKLDMKFLCGEVGDRGGIILNSVVQMARWLGTPVITEGVETMEQADFMKSLGCNYIQGYLYSKPLEEPAFIEKIGQIEHEAMTPAMEFINTVDAGKFWDPASMETLIFSNLVGAAAIFTYKDSGEMEVVRVNKKYLREIGMNMTEQETIAIKPWDHFRDDGLKIFTNTIRRAIASGEEESCETWRDICSKSCGDAQICLLTELRVIGTAGNQHLIYAMVHNITKEKELYNEVFNSDRRFRYASEQAKIYAWEYTISTKQMRPCFRCMRDLNLPPLIYNYPEPLIENGVFPPDYADMYREMMRKIDAGVPHIEAIIPLTVGRIPFHVRYTTEFDENGHPLKAYGSATLVVDEQQQTKAATGRRVLYRHPRIRKR